MAKRYRSTFEIFDTEKQAKAFCDACNFNASRYVRKNHPSIYTPWTSIDGKEHKFIAWYATK